jgi:glycosyltransferase involved in cell wall biosynthesis
MEIGSNENMEVTVFMPVYNGSEYLKESISSVLSQTYSQFELLIINDASTDSSVQIIESFNDSRIKLLHNETNLGINKTRNRGLHEAKTKFLAVLDCDDIADSRRLEYQVKFLKENLSYAACGSDANIINEKSEIIGAITHAKEHDDIVANLLFANQFVHSSVLFDLEKIKAIGEYRTDILSEDYEFLFRISQQFKVANLPYKLVDYRNHSASVSKTKLEKMNYSEMAILKDIYSQFDLDSNLLEIPHTFFTYDISTIKKENISLFFESILNANSKKQLFPEKIFNKIVLNKWIEIVVKSKSKPVLNSLLQNQLFSYSELNWQQLRRILKLKFKLIFA